MMSKTHTSFALSLGLLPICIYPNIIIQDELPLYIGSLTLGALIPDIDEPQSYIGRKIPFLPRIIKYLFGHRGITHQFVFFLILFISVFAFESTIKNTSDGLFTMSIGFTLGILFHQIGDMLSGSKYFKGGIRDYFFPLTSSGKYFTPFPKIIRCAVGDRKEQIYNFVFILVIVFEFKQIFNISI